MFQGVPISPAASFSSSPQSVMSINLTNPTHVTKYTVYVSEALGERAAMRDEKETGFTRAFHDLGICHLEPETNQSRRGETTFTLGLIMALALILSCGIFV